MKNKEHVKQGQARTESGIFESIKVSNEVKELVDKNLKCPYRPIIEKELERLEEIKPIRESNKFYYPKELLNQKPNKASNKRSVDLAKAITMLKRLPVCLDWVNYKGKDVVIQWNLEATIKAKKPMVDVSYCMTKALNQIIDKTVQWDKNKFKSSTLSNHKWV